MGDSVLDSEAARSYARETLKNAQPARGSCSLYAVNMPF